MTKSLESMKLTELREIGKELGIKSLTALRKQALIDRILAIRKEQESAVEFADVVQEEEKETESVEVEEETEPQSEETGDTEEPKKRSERKEHRRPEATRDNDGKVDVHGVLDLHPDGYGFLRSDHYYSGENDTYVPPQQVRRFRLKTGDYIEGITREKTNEKFNALIYVKTVNGDTPENLRQRPDFDDFTPIYPDKRITLEHDKHILASRLVDLIAPIGRGQRGLLVSPPKAGKTTLLKQIANAISVNHPDIEIIVLLIDERPEEVTDIRRSVQGDVIASTFDELPQNHVRISEIVLERAKRLVEHGKDVVILLDSITRLTRAYNLVQPASGKILSGGIDPSAFHKPKRFFGAARNIEHGGSLTIIATALVDTGSRMDDVIYEEFKGTGNMELHLDRDLANLRIYPAIDIVASGTRREESLLSDAELNAMVLIRRLLQRDNDNSLLEKMYDSLRRSDTNSQFIQQMIREGNGA